MLSSFVPTQRLHQLPAPPDGDGPLAGLESPDVCPRGLVRDLKTLAKFVGLYCQHQHPGVLKRPVAMKHLDVTTLMGRPIHLCPSCTRLVTHAMIKRTSCPLDPKPQCKRCTSHCYHPAYRKKMKEVMRFSGMKLVLSGRLDYLLHLFF